jgi:two-component system, LytTR family, response regulator
MSRVLIIEDDPQHATDLLALITMTQPEINVLKICTNISDSLLAIKDLKPDLIFLDIELDRGETGFDLLKKINEPNFSIVFTTQFITFENAQLAIRACALDVLAKPVTLDDLNNSIQRIDRVNAAQQIATLFENEDNVNAIWINTTEGKFVIKVSNIIYCTSDNYLTTFYLYENIGKYKKIISTERIGLWEMRLTNSPIIRVHREYLINMQFVISIKNLDNGRAEILLVNNIKVEVSKSRKKETEKKIKLFLKSK